MSTTADARPAKVPSAASHIRQIVLRIVEVQDHHPFAQAIFDVGGKKDIERGLAGSALGGKEGNDFHTLQF